MDENNHKFILKIRFTSKIKSIKELAQLCSIWRNQGLKIAYSHGCFDPIYIGHVWHFEEARSYADILIVTVTPDLFILKGKGRPLFQDKYRVESIASCMNVDFVGLNEWPTAIEALKKIKPHIFCKGIDYSEGENGNLDPRYIEEQNIARSLGIEIVTTKSNKFSSTEIVKKAINLLEGNFEIDYAK